MTVAPEGIDPDRLIAELPQWNDGRGGVDARAWVGMMGSYDLAVGYSLVFWPRFIRVDGYVLRQECYTEANLRDWERSCPGERSRIEAVINHLHIADLHCNDTETLTDDQIRYLGRILKASWSAKLRADFPELTFVVSFPEEPEYEGLDYEITFWQAEPAA